MPVSARERLHFALIGEAMADEKRAQRRDALASTPAERIAVGFRLAAVPRDAASEALLDARAAGQLGLAARRRRQQGG
jgi:hypothetical protein